MMLDWDLLHGKRGIYVSSVLLNRQLFTLCARGSRSSSTYLLWPQALSALCLYTRVGACGHSFFFI